MTAEPSDPVAESETSRLTSHSFEVSGGLDRATAEALMLEIKRLGRRHAVVMQARIERALDPGEELST
jgi:hypothetical protein